jgi:outer membrane protein assembly factor BamB
MKRWLLLAILGCMPLIPASSAGASPHSDWPSLDADAAHSNSNSQEKTLTAKSVLKLKVKWALPIPAQSYPVVWDGQVFIPFAAKKKIHVRAVDALTGKTLHTYARDAGGGILAGTNGLALAGSSLQVLDPSTGAIQNTTGPPPGTSGGTYLNPTADSKVMLVGYATSSRSSTGNLYTIDLTSSAILHKLPSSTAQGTIGAHNRVLTQTGTGGALYDEQSGRSVAKHPAIFGPWFAGDTFSYTVAAVAKKSTYVMAYDASGKRQWYRALGPPYAVQDWPHAVTPTAVFVERVRPAIGVEALDPLTGAVLWTRSVANVQRLAQANGVLYILTYALGQPVRLVALNATTGSLIGVIGLSTGFYAFPEQNDLMVADGMIFIRAIGPGNVQQLVALGL